MEQLLNRLTLNNLQFHRLSLRRRVALSQAPFAATVLFLFVGAALFHAEVLAAPLVQLGFGVTVLLTVLAAAMPWDRLPYPSFLLVPVLDFLPIFFLREGAGTLLTALGLLAVFPVIWLAASGQLPRTSIVAGTLATLLMVWVPLFAATEPVTATTLTRPLLLPFIMLAIAITIRAMTASMMEQQRVVEAQDERLRALLAASGRRERLVSSIVDAVDVGVLALNEDGEEILANRKQRSLRRLAFESEEQDGPRIFGPDGTTPLARNKDPRQRAAAGQTFSDYLVWLGEQPDQRVLSTSARAIRDDAGRREGAVVTFNDVTELVTALNAKDEFLSSVSHELRTPLTSILGYAELLGLTEDLPPAAVDGLEVISRNSKRLLAMVNDLLETDAARRIHPAAADLAEIIRHSAAAAEPRAAEARVRLATELPGPLPAVFDAGRLSQVLDNLLSNAIKYSREGGNITVTARREDGGLVCTVRDEGIGMNDTDAAEVFARFFRSPAVRRSAIPGIGLGLAIAKNIVEQHGGRIWCESKPGAGTSFSFTLPEKPAPAPGVYRGGGSG